MAFLLVSMRISGSNVVKIFKQRRLSKIVKFMRNLIGLLSVITLVPKVESPISMVHFCLISLCSTLYKVVSKIIVARLRPILPDLLSPNQVSSILGCHFTDNIIIAQELIHKFKISKGKKGFMIFLWKIDLSKAYDGLNLNFV